jgi:hypothetical protein
MSFSSALLKEKGPESGCLPGLQSAENLARPERYGRMNRADSGTMAAGGISGAQHEHEQQPTPFMSGLFIARSADGCQR